MYTVDWFISTDYRTGSGMSLQNIDIIDTGNKQFFFIFPNYLYGENAQSLSRIRNFLQTGADITKKRAALQHYF
jgi:hypothetical protein